MAKLLAHYIVEKEESETRYSIVEFTADNINLVAAFSLLSFPSELIKRNNFHLFRFLVTKSFHSLFFFFVSLSKASSFEGILSDTYNEFGSSKTS